MLMIAPVKAVIGFAASSMLWAQIAPLVPVPVNIDSMGRLTLDTALGIAVVWLARTLMATIKASDDKITAMIAAKDAKIAEKDKQLIDMATKVTETMALVMVAVKELRTATEEIGAAMDNLASNIGAIPCAMKEQVIARVEKQDASRHRAPVRG